MTVGITLTNGEEAIAITDKRVSAMYRKSDSINKMGIFNANNNNYSGVLFGTGLANPIEGIIKGIYNCKSKNLEKFSQDIYLKYRTMLNKADHHWLNTQYEELEKKAMLFTDAQEQAEEIYKGKQEVIANYNEYKAENFSDFMVVGYDKLSANRKIRIFRVTENGSNEQYADHHEIGGGYDGANIYLWNKLQGLDLSKLSFSDLAFFSINAYSSSTVNSGVGGSPKIAKISKKGCEILSPEKTNFLVNLSGAYLAQINSKMNRDPIREFFDEILQKTNPNYEKIAKNYELNADVMKQIYIPYSSWQEKSNQNFYK
jgi:hypothetical protein